ncbi:NEDD8-activating enzyme E1 regulatory subunit [Lepeophtheirus salmonis]|uniref:NEDD8-activating enzyme E1 regulatory subunit n=1 Tax=Lepeophtheirus salmonis TaxID=72036 RepID=UPI001AE7DE47|nr:NEDD8-activating enzyme E1 regulatory subunit-like [Lepeophtheirus salmonis]
MTSTPSPGGCPPCSPAQSEKARRYDRQLRLWGDHGQILLEKSHVCLLHANATGTEILKSLVLPGVGAFTIVDDKKVSGEDLGNNFFLEESDLDQNRGEVAARLLLELNPEVRGDCVDDCPEQILRAEPNFFLGFNIVIACEVREDTLKTISKMLWIEGIPLITVRTYGFISYIRLQIKEHTIVEAHPDNIIEDLCLDMPFPALKEFFDSQDLSKMNKKEHAHTPYVVILFKALQIWMQNQNTNKLPHNYKERNVVKGILNQLRLTNDEGIPEHEENFDEALKATNTALHNNQLSSHVIGMFKNECCDKLTSDSTDFWIICRSIRDFVQLPDNGRLPVRGIIPDMFSDTERYVTLQNIYKEKAKADANLVYKFVQEHLESVGRQSDSISETTVRLFCRNSFDLRVIRSNCSISDEYDKYESSELKTILENNSESDLVYYFILRGVDKFYTEFSSYPGSIEYLLESDISKLKNCVSKVLSDYGLSGLLGGVVKDEYIHEITRYGASEPHVMAAFIGGCAAQEVIKLLTRQYVPINNLFLYNAMKSESLTAHI